MNILNNTSSTKLEAALGSVAAFANRDSVSWATDLLAAAWCSTVHLSNHLIRAMKHTA